MAADSSSISDYETDSNQLLHCQTVYTFFHYSISLVYLFQYLVMNNGDHLCMNSLRILTSAWLDASKSSRDSVRFNKYKSP